MFGKDNRKKGSVSKENAIDIDASLQGEFTFRCPVNLKISRSFEGSLNTKGTLTIGKGAKVKADIKGDEIIIERTLEGDITAEKCIKLVSSGKLFGNIKTPGLVIAHGGIFQGKCHMGLGDKKSEVPRENIKKKKTK